MQILACEMTYERRWVRSGWQTHVTTGPHAADPPIAQALSAHLRDTGALAHRTQQDQCRSQLRYTFSGIRAHLAWPLYVFTVFVQVVANPVWLQSPPRDLSLALTPADGAHTL